METKVTQEEFSYSYLAERGEKVTEKLANAIRKEHWLINIIGLAWTAGPLTYIALQVGYYLGYGKFASVELFIYFAAYTLIAGFSAVATRIIYNLTHTPKIENTKTDLLHLIDKLSNIIIAARNQLLTTYDPEERKIAAACYLLLNHDASEDAIHTAIYDLTDSLDLARAARRIESFRKFGLYSRILEEYSAYHQDIIDTAEQLRATYPEAAQMFLNRMRGISPNVKLGNERVEGFIERVLIAGETNNNDLMTLHDVIEMLIFAFELINGRNIPLLEPKFSANENFIEAEKALDKARSEYRIARLQRNNRLKALAELLVSQNDDESILNIHNMDEEALFTLINDSFTRYQTLLSTLIQEITSDDYTNLRIFQKHTETMTAAIPLYKTCIKKNTTVLKKLDILEKQRNRFTAAHKNYRSSTPWKITLHKNQHKTVRIVEREITLHDDDKLDVIKSVQKLLDDIEIKKSNRKAFRSTDDDNANKPFDSDDYKNLAIGIAMILNKHLDLTSPKVQFAIENSNSANLIALELGISAQTKAGWASAIINEIQKNMRKASHNLAETLVNKYGIPLNKQAITFFVERYGADEEKLKFIAKHGKTNQPTDEYHPPKTSPPQLNKKLISIADEAKFLLTTLKIKKLTQ